MIASFRTYFGIIVLVFFNCAPIPKTALEVTEKSSVGNNNRNGIWKMYLSELGSVPKEKAKYFEFVYYFEGWLVFPYPYTRFEANKIIHVGTDTVNDGNKPQMLNGTYHLFDSKDCLQAILEYESGYRIKGTYFWPGKNCGKIYMTEDYKKMYNNTPFTCYISYYNPDGTIYEKGYYRPYRKINSPWDVVKERIP